MQITKNDRPILSVEDWFQLAPPKRGLRHWVDGRSAKELAKAFFRNGMCSVPNEVAALLATSTALGSVELVSAWPEHPTRLDSYRGEPRNADLAAIGSGRVGRVAVAIEAKADEPYGSTIAEELAVKRDGSNVPKRIESLARAVLGKPAEEVGALRYQLLHATAATLILAQEHSAAAAVFLILEFLGSSCSPQNQARNMADLNAFLRALSPTSGALTAGRLCGPLRVPGGDRVHADIPLFIGKASLPASNSA
jgi:hypothetical protein